MSSSSRKHMVILCANGNLWLKFEVGFDFLLRILGILFKIYLYCHKTEIKKGKRRGLILAICMSAEHSEVWCVC